MSRCKLVVTYGPHTARFSARVHAFEFARYISGMSGHVAEVRDASGLVGQYEDGEPTPEFSHLTRQGAQPVREAA